MAPQMSSFDSSTIFTNQASYHTSDHRMVPRETEKFPHDGKTLLIHHGKPLTTDLWNLNPLFKKYQQLPVNMHSLDINTFRNINFIVMQHL